ncbi:replication initiation protein [Tortoise microvirus 14]|nr:replication initiation protein [Tortoise microvirus 14]
MNTKIILNKKYLPNKKNGGIPPTCPDEKFRYVEIPCGYCYECRAKKSRDWSIRINEEIKNSKMSDFLTLTISNEEYKKLSNELYKELRYNQISLDSIAALAIRRFLENVRKYNKKSVRHWAITEKGQKGTKRLHIHMIVFDPISRDYKKYWKYGHIYIGEYCNERTAAYIVKYMLKKDEINSEFKPRVFASPGIGKSFINGRNEQNFDNEETREFYRFKNGTKSALPKYYRDKLYNENQRLYLWGKKIDENITYIGGEKLKDYTAAEINSIKNYYRKKYQQIHGDKYKIEEELLIKRREERENKHKKFYQPTRYFLESKEE